MRAKERVEAAGRRDGEWEEFSHHMGKGSMYVFVRAKLCVLPLCEPAKTTLQNEICIGSYSYLLGLLGSLHIWVTSFWSNSVALIAEEKITLSRRV